MAYASDESGRNEVYVRPFPEVDKDKRQVSINGGTAPLWSSDGREIFYLNGDAVMAVSVETKTGFNLSTPNLLFRATYAGSYPADGTPWDVSLDAKRFLMMKDAETGDDESTTAVSRKINIVLKWFEGLKERAPVD